MLAMLAACTVVVSAVTIWALVLDRKLTEVRVRLNERHANFLEMADRYSQSILARKDLIDKNLALLADNLKMHGELVNLRMLKGPLKQCPSCDSEFACGCGESQ